MLFFTLELFTWKVVSKNASIPTGLDKNNRFKVYFEWLPYTNLNQSRDRKYDKILLPIFWRIFCTFKKSLILKFLYRF